MICHLPSSLRPQAGEVVISTERGGEFRELVVAQPNERQLVAYEFSSGPITAEVFESPWREHRVCMSAYDAAFVLGPSSGDPLAALMTFIQSGDRTLADLMDLLDAALVPYRYDFQTNGHDLITRVPSPQEVG